MSGFITAVIVGGLLGYLLACNNIDESVEKQYKGKNLNELTDKELNLVYKEVNIERFRRWIKKENSPFEEFEEGEQ